MIGYAPTENWRIFEDILLVIYSTIVKPYIHYNKGFPSKFNSRWKNILLAIVTEGTFISH